MRVFFVGGLRTPFGKVNGAYANVRPDDLLVTLFEEQKGKNRALIDLTEDSITGCAYPENEQGYNVARMASLGAGLSLPGLTINRLCGSSLEAVIVAGAKIKSGFHQCIFVSGIESMSRVTRRGENFSESERIKQVSPKAYIDMGTTAENVCQKTKISRAEQEDFSIRSHELADRAYQNGFYQDVGSVFGASRDEGIRVPVNVEKLKTLKPAFKENGVVTAATSSPLSDGASSGFVVSEDILKRLGIKGATEILDASVSHVEPEVMGLGPIPAIETLFKRNQLNASKVQAFELNEAFSVQVLAAKNELSIPLDSLNTKGGAISIGHPLGASGLRLMSTLDLRLKEIGRNSLGIASLCVGGGQGIAILAKHVSF